MENMEKKDYVIISLAIICVILFVLLMLQDVIIFTESRTGYITDIESRIYEEIGEAHVFIKFDNESLYSVFRISDHTKPFSSVIMENKTCTVTWYRDGGMCHALLSIEILMS